MKEYTQALSTDRPSMMARPVVESEQERRVLGEMYLDLNQFPPLKGKKVGADCQATVTLHIQNVSEGDDGSCRACVQITGIFGDVKKVGVTKVEKAGEEGY